MSGTIAGDDEIASLVDAIMPPPKVGEDLACKTAIRTLLAIMAQRAFDRGYEAGWKEADETRESA